MPKKFEVQVEAERFIHNELSSASMWFVEQCRSKIQADDTSGLAFPMMATVVFSVFDLEAKANFVGWKLFGDDWDDGVGLEKKINRLASHLGLPNDWTANPLAAIKVAVEFRNTVAHGKPDVVENESFIVENEPEIWEALEAQWEKTLTPEMVEMVYSAVDEIWKQWLTTAGISIMDTLTHGGHSVRPLAE